MDVDHCSNVLLTILCNVFSGEYVFITTSSFILATDLLLAWNPICLGLVEGVIGKIQLHSGMFL